MNASRLISVIGAGSCDASISAIAYDVGRLLAECGFGVVCGGLGGVMSAACQGCYEAGGMTVGLLPGPSVGDANPFVHVAMPTGLGEARNALVVRAGEAVIAIGGEYGTLSEIGFALKIGKRVVGIGTWELARGGSVDGGIVVANSAEEAVRLVVS